MGLCRTWIAVHDARLPQVYVLCHFCKVLSHLLLVRPMKTLKRFGVSHVDARHCYFSCFKLGTLVTDEKVDGFRPGELLWCVHRS